MPAERGIARSRASAICAERRAGADDDDGRRRRDMPAEQTRIESNPLELLEQMNVAAKTRRSPRRPARRRCRRHRDRRGPPPLPAPPTGPAKPVVPQASGKFPDLANLPTKIAERDARRARRSCRPSASGPRRSSQPTPLVREHRSGCRRPASVRTGAAPRVARRAPAGHSRQPPRAPQMPRRTRCAHGLQVIPRR